MNYEHANNNFDKKLSVRKNRLHILLACVLLFANFYANAQSPSSETCLGAIEKPVTEFCEETTHTFGGIQTDYWLFFTTSAGLSQLRVQYLNEDYAQSIQLSKIEIYSGSCGSLVLDTTFDSPDYDSLYQINGLDSGEVYYLKIVRDVIVECPTGCLDGKGFELCLKSTNVPCLVWGTELLVSPGYIDGGFCNDDAGARCNISILPCEQFCFAVGCIPEYPGGEITYIMNPTTPDYNIWFETTDDIECIPILGSLLTPGATYEFAANILEPGGTTTYVNFNLYLTVLPVTNAYDAVLNNTFCTYQDLINAIIQDGFLTTVYVDGMEFDFGDPIEAELLFNSLSPGTHNVCAEFLNECNQYSQFCEPFEIEVCAPSFSATINCNTVTIINSTPFQSSYVSWFWNFGDGTTSNVAQPGTHIYSNPGTYTITLTVVNNVGDTFVLTQTVTPVFGTPIILDLPTNSCCTQPTITVNNDYHDYIWTTSPVLLFSGGNNFIEPVLDDQTTYEICVTAIDNLNGCPVSACGIVEPCCGFNSTLVQTSPISQDNHTIGDYYFSQNCEPESVQYLIDNFAWDTIPDNATIVLRNDLIVDADITFALNSVRIDEDKKIFVKSGVTLTIDKSHLSNACDNMWDGIYLEDDNAHLVITNGSSVRQAKNAVVSDDGGDFLLENSLFLNNYRNVVVNGYNALHPGSIKQCVFRGTPFGMLPPHSSDYLPYSGVEVTKVREITIGAPFNTTFKNEFRRLQYGILSTASNISIYNNEFDQINLPSSQFSNQINNNDAIAIWIKDGSSSAPTQFANIGNAGTPKNKFTGCRKGIQAEGNISPNIIGNEFLNTTITNVYCRKTNGKSINVLNNTMDGRFGIGVLCVDFLKSIVQIKNNLIDENNAYNHTASYLNAGIWLANVVPNASLYQIENNQIYRCENGIIADGVPTVLIKSNSVTYQRNNVQIANTGRIHRGIWIKNSKDNETTLNTISRTSTNPASDGTQNMTNYLHGITVELSEESYVHDNNMTRMGYGMRWVGNSIHSTISCNIMQRCFNGIYFDQAEIGDQGSLTTPSGNFWVQNQGFAGKLNGNLVLPLTNWYADFSSQITSPTPQNVPLTQIAFSNSTNSANCQIAPGGTSPGPFNQQKREALFGSIVRDEKQFIANASENRMNNRKYLYLILKSDPSIMTLGAPDDADYLNFFANISSENEGKIEEVNLLIADTNYIAAANLNSTIQVNLIAEENQKILNEIYLSTWANGMDIDSTQYLLLESIACQNPLDGGAAVFGSRIMIGLDYECASSASRSVTFLDEEIIEEETMADFNIYPNPTSGQITIKNNSEELINGKLQIFDITGKFVAEYQLNNIDFTKISLAELPEGMYHYLIFSNEVSVFADKFVISK